MDIGFRQKQLGAFVKMLEECSEQLLGAVYNDMRKSSLEGLHNKN